MANYRFKTAEMDAMKKNILTHIGHETENKTAWRLRCAIEGQLMCCRPSKRETSQLRRELALYERLTKNDLPNWQSEPTQPATPSETHRISTKTAETVNVSAEGENAADVAENKAVEKAKTFLFPNYAKAMTMLNAKLSKLQNEAHKYDDCYKLSRKKYFSDAKRQIRIGEQCTAIEAALALLNGKQWHELDIYNVVLMSVNSRNSEKDKMLEYAYGGGLYEKQKALMYAFETSLPICKKQVLDAIQMQIKNSTQIRRQEPPQSPETPQTGECAAEPKQGGTDELNDKCECRVCSHCGKHFHEGYYLGDEYACSEECAVALYGGDREQLEADLEMEEEEPGTTECYWSVWR